MVDLEYIGYLFANPWDSPCGMNSLLYLSIEQKLFLH